MSELSTAERGAVVAAVMAVGPAAPEMLARVSERCRTEAERLLAMDREARAVALARELAAIDAPVPVGLALVHRDWLELALAGETDAVRDAVAGGGATPAPLRSWLQRRAFGHLVAMPGPDDGATTAVLARAPVVALLDALAVFGRDALAAALVRSEPREVATVAARLGEPHGSALVARVAELARAGAGDIRALAAHVRPEPGGAPEHMLIDAGIRRLAAALAGAPGDAPRQLAQRLPPDLGRRLIAARAASASATSDSGDLAAFAALVDAGRFPDMM